MSISPVPWRKAQLCQHIVFGMKGATQIEVTHNFYAAHSMPYAKKNSVNQLAQKLHIKCLWNGHQIDGQNALIGIRFNEGFSYGVKLMFSFLVF